MSEMSDSRAKTDQLAEAEQSPLSTEMEVRLAALFENVGRLRGDDRFRVSQRKAWVEFTDDRREDFLIALAYCGRMGDAALAAGVSPRTVRRHVEQDEDFADLVEMAREAYRDSVRIAIHEEGVEGRLEPVIAKDGDGNPQIVDYIRKRNPKILELAAKLHLPEYRSETAINVNVDARTGVLVAPAIGGEDDWEAKFGGKVLPPQGQGLPGIESSRILEQGSGEKVTR